MLPPTRPSLLLALRDSRDEAAWREFVDLYLPLIHGYCRRKNLQDADAADVAQEVMQVVVREVRRFEYDQSKGRFRGWLFAIVRHKLAKHFARRPLAGAAPSGPEAVEIPDPSIDPREEALWETEYRRRLFDWAAEKVQGEFENTSWQAFWLTNVDEVPAKEVADRLGLSVGAVYIARSRVLARLREKVASVAGEELPP